MAKKKAKPVNDSQLSDDIEKLLEKKGVDEDVITEVTAKINDTNEDEDADGDVLDKEDDVDIEEKDDEEAEDADKVDEEEIDIEEETDDEGDGEDEEDFEDEDVEEEEDDEVEDAEADPLAKLDDPTFKEGFDKGFKFARELAKLEGLEVGGDSDEEVDEEIDEDIDEEDDEVEDAEGDFWERPQRKGKPVPPYYPPKNKPKPAPAKDAADEEENEDAFEDDIARKKACKGMACDSVDELTKSISAKINKSYQERIAASEKVQSLVGKVDIMAFDSANGIYQFALEQNGVDVDKYDKKAYEGMIDMMLVNANKVEIPGVVGDSKKNSAFDAGFEDAFERLKNIDR